MHDQHRKVPFAIDAFLFFGLIAAPLLIAAAIVIAVFVVRPFLDKDVHPSAQVTPDIPAGALGTEHAACGGPERLPCIPGFVCSLASDQWGSGYGTCIADTRPTYPAGKVGDACDLEHGCEEGSVCGMPDGKTAGICVKIDVEKR